MPLRFLLFLLLILFSCGFGYTSCHTKELQDIEEYSQHSKNLHLQMLRYRQSLRKAKQAQTYRELQSHLHQKVLPFLEQYVSGLQQIKPRTRILQKIHLHLTNAYERWQKSLQKYTAKLQSEASWVRHAPKLLNAAKKLEHAEKTYRQRINRYIHKLKTKAMTP